MEQFILVHNKKQENKNAGSLIIGDRVVLFVNQTLSVCYWKVVKLPVGSVAGMLRNTRLRLLKDKY